jgi:nucleotide-binding universal stress UspA family protein
MTTTTEMRRRAAARQPSIFRRVVVGVDGSPEAREALRQAAVLLDRNGALTVVSAYDVAPTLIGGTGSGVPAYFDPEMQRQAAESVLRTACYDVHDHATPDARLVKGRAAHALAKTADETRASLIAVGSHGTGRAWGILAGSTATALAHGAPCSVLIARAAGADFPRKIVVGVDGSRASAVAYETARELAERFGAELWPVAARGGKGADTDAVATVVDRAYEELADEPVAALVAASADADLTVVGSRGLHGVAALGSVSERVAHEAHASVLVVRHGRPRN